jgi:pseudouridine-5'-phosphate glycosidase
VHVGTQELRDAFAAAAEEARAGGGSGDSLAFPRPPIVALESTIISHGMPYPQNVETALAVEDVVRKAGAIPATIALADGKVCIGLDVGLLERLGKEGTRVRKVSRRDFASVIASRGLGATTVAGTMMAASFASIPVFATGGIGGVHRGVGETWDVSADLTELGRTPVTVVCAGVKSILDIAKTLEYLETQGVPVVAFQTSEFPAFFSPTSGLPAPERSDTTSAIARHMVAARRMGLQNGMVVAVPPPEPVDGGVIEAAISAALREAEAKGVRGKDITPFLLERVATLTKGASLRANIGLVKANANVAAHIAVDLTKFLKRTPRGATSAAAPAAASATATPAPAPAEEKPKPAQAKPRQDNRRRGGSPRGIRGPRTAAVAGTAAVTTAGKTVTTTAAAPAATQTRGFATSAAAAASLPRPSLPNGVPAFGRPIVVGGAVVDVLCAPLPGKPLVRETSNPGTVTQSYGGVGRNVAEAAARLGASEAAARDVSRSVFPFLQSGGSGRVQPPLLVTALGASSGAGLLRHCESVGMEVSTCAPLAGAAAGGAPAATASYVALMDGGGELVAAVADMSAFDALTPDAVRASASAAASSSPSSSTSSPFEQAVSSTASFVVCDANIPAQTVRYLARAAAGERTGSGSPPRPPVVVPFLFEPISTAKSTKIVDADSLHLATVLKPNKFEVIALAQAIRHRLGLAPLPDDDEGEEGEGEGDAEAGGADARSPASKRAGNGTSVKTETIHVKHLDKDSVGAGQPPITWTRVETDGEAAVEAVEGEGEAGDDEPFDYRLITAAQTVLAAMVRPCGLGAPLSRAAFDIGWRGIETREGAAVVREAFPDFTLPDQSASSSSPHDAAAEAAAVKSAWEQVARGSLPSASSPDVLYPGGLVEGRKHLLVTLGAKGMLWLSAAPLPTGKDAADLAFVLPFFTAAAHPAINFDFKHVLPCPVPAGEVRKATGAGDTLVGTVVWALSRGATMAQALRAGAAGGAIAVRGEPGGGAVPRELTVQRLAAGVQETPEVEGGYC